MAKEPNHEEDLWIEGMNRQLDRLDQMFEEVNSPTLEQLELLAVRTAQNRRRRMRREFMIFLLVAVFLAGGGLMAALSIPVAFMIIHGVSLLSGITILLLNKGIRGEGKRDIQ
ncbi:YxlC family protein [Paenibacillus dakarensis]|uniref:YxlC family protein n=1 Tax=Paenibacillus dakarensis TaxID=1527293 RepID=UPI0006D53B35|nr:YxlC family protein [Paenibacillus dakarensis]